MGDSSWDLDGSIWWEGWVGVLGDSSTCAGEASGVVGAKSSSGWAVEERTGVFVGSLGPGVGEAVGDCLCVGVEGAGWMLVDSWARGVDGVSSWVGDGE